LGEGLENTGQHFRVDTNAGVLDTHSGLILPAVSREPNCASGFSVLQRIVQKVKKYLGDPTEIALYVNRLFRQGNQDVVFRWLRKGTAGFEGKIYRLGKIKMRLLQSDFPSLDPRDIYEIINKVNNLGYLAFYDLLGTISVCSLFRQFERNSNSFKRIAKLMRKSGSPYGGRLP
jgi:hypothetical protein